MRYYIMLFSVLGSDFASLPYFTEVKNSYELSNVAEVDGLHRVLRT